ncbi:hypothetical protein S40285_03706 [Stachybotrys chlorohalonatus IBT 40285]|uniref:Myb-like domain-containing protein n=1 Tax=Stachybotrys chlorohalonatus (strain IBT 40285) TaxID=1283841 RepID=A0A084QPX9_STAC4|nr:hypothetical protein S40285_03706 [Stachybotrys chlorohalonata IBT 40285]
MSPPHVTQLAPAFAPVSDAIDRHDSGVSKCRKAASTGGGRAWSEDEEVYLLQTRLQKMPYKHIAAHLKKTELACRLHYHQLSHGSNRRKRTPSFSSGSETSPVMHATMPSPARESQSRSLSPPNTSYGLPLNAVQLPSIMTDDGPSKLPAILPKPLSMEMPRRGVTPPLGYPSAASDRHTSLPPANFPKSTGTPPLRLDCSGLPSVSLPHAPAHVDLNRLHHIYSVHRNSFWAAVANDYGCNTSPAVLEQAFKTSICNQFERGGSPMTPAASPANSDRDGYIRGQDKIRISSILADVDPRSAHDRDMVRRMDVQRFPMSASM